MSNQLEYQTVILAAFLHDIGKLLGRGSFKILDKGQHPQFSATFISAHHDLFARVVDADMLKELVQKHHENERAFPSEFLVKSITDEHRRNLAALVSLADNLSSSERGEASDKYQDYKKTSLCSVIERLSTESDSDSSLRFHPRPLSSTNSPNTRDILFPARFTEYEAGEMNKLIESFGSNFNQVFRNINGNLDFECLANHLTNLIYTHTWCIPSNTQELVPDVSLFDHLKTTAAIAGCLYQYHSRTDTLNEKAIKNISQPRFLIVTGDISGIQQYIFDITASTVGGVARMLRARSLMVQLYSEVAAHKILHNLGLPSWNLIMNSGGNFFMLLPNIEEARKGLDKIQKEIDDWFFHNANGELALNLAWHSFDNQGFRAASDKTEGFSRIIYEVKTILNQKKQNRFCNILHNNNWNESYFTIPVDFAGKESCGSCHKYPAQTELRGMPVCLKCRRESELGAILPKTKYISFFADEKSGNIPIFNYSASLTEKPVNSGNPYLIVKLNDPEVSEITNLPVQFKYLAMHIPQENGQTITFEDIAKKADGQHCIGFLKADVDRLGELFVFGLQREKESIDTISRQATTSRLLDTFFSGWLQSLVSLQFPDCYIIFSGGDDLFIVGPWDKILLLAERIHDDFTMFTGNQQLTISAGIVITKSSYPVARAAAEVDIALELAKEQGRNRITIINRTLTWSDWLELKKEWEFFRNIMAAREGASLSSAFLYSLQSFADMWQQYKNGNVQGLRFHPLLSYNISRNLDERKTPELYKWAQKLLIWPPKDDTKKLLDNLGLIVALSLLNKRGGKE